MIKNDKQLGKPFTHFGATAAAIETLSAEEGMAAFATNTKQFGFYNNTNWLWATATPAANAIPISNAAANLNAWIAAGTPTSLDVASVNTEGVGAEFARAAHIHQVITDNNPGAEAAILASSDDGWLTLVRLNTDTISDRSGGNLSIAPTGDLELDPTGAQVRVMAAHTLQSDHYASQTTGWGISYAGGGDFRYLYADELHVKSFIADLEQALAGGQIITKSVAVLSRDFTAPAAGEATTLYVQDLPSAENMAVFESGDIVRVRTFSRADGSLTVADCWGVVTSYTDLSDKEQSWTFTRSTGGNSGTMTAATVVAADALVLDYGTTGNGFYEVNAIDGLYAENSPYSQIVTWVTHPATGKTVRVRMGNLHGITATTEYGLFAGDGVAAGDAYIRLTDQNFELHNLDMAFYDVGNVQRIGIDPGAGSTDNLMWMGASSASVQFAVRGNGDVYLTDCNLSITDGNFTLKTTASGARVQIDANGISAYSDDTTQTVSLETDGDFFAGSDIAAAATTSLAVFANAQTYNSENMGTSDVLLGDNSSGKSNLLWDKSDGALKIRQGTESRIIFDPDGLMRFEYSANGETYNSILWSVSGDAKASIGVGIAPFTTSAYTLDLRCGYARQSGISIISGESSTSDDEIRMGINADQLVIANSQISLNSYVELVSVQMAFYDSSSNQLVRLGNMGTTVAEITGDIELDGDLIGSGTIQTAAGYEWDLGAYVDSVVADTGYVDVTIGGTTYKLLARVEEV